MTISAPNDPRTEAPPARNGPALTRREMLTYVVSAPVLTLAAGTGINLALPGTAQALPLPLTPPDTTDYYDTGEVVMPGSLATMPLVKLEVGTDGRVRLALPRLESGQGIATACGMMVAEELSVPLSSVDVTLADARPELLLNQFTGGSTNVRVFYAALPVMAATARARLIAAAAQQWGLSASTLSASAGVVIAPDGRTATYASLSVAAASIAAPSGVVPKSPTQYTLIGQRAGRLDARDIVTGQKKFTMDIDVPGAKPTLVRRPPTVRGTVVAVNNAAAVSSMPGVIGLVTIPAGGTISPNPPGVAVMAETFGQAWAAVNALDVTWGPGPIDNESNDTIQQKLHNSIAPFAVPPLGSLTIDAEFEMAPASHCPMETECAIADVRTDRAEIWSRLQCPIATLQAIAQDLGLSQDKVKVHVVSSGGAFGRGVFWDAVQQAIHVSRALGRPCKLMYHRTDDMRHARMRPHQYHKCRATVLLGQVVSYEQRIASPRLDLRHGLGEILTATAVSAPPSVQQSIGNLAFEEATFKVMVTSPYNFGVVTKALLPASIEMNTCTYRSVHIQPARGVEEIMVDEIAAAVGKDPVAFRLEYLRMDRARAVLQKVAAVAGWGKAMPAGFAQGVGVHQESRSVTACIVEIDGRDPNAAKVTKAVIAVDVGRPINLSGIEAQLQGGLVESISLVLTAGLHLDKGLPLEGSYSQYHFARMKSYPKDVQIIVMPASGDTIGGLGEVGMSATTGAIANAYARATGIKPRKFPLNFPVDFTPIPPGKLPTPTIL
jgi:isoquinoline 1-oxidoreductase beta subunit